MLEVRVDGETLIRYRVRREGQVLDDRSAGPAPGQAPPSSASSETPAAASGSA